MHARYILLDKFCTLRTAATHAIYIGDAVLTELRIILLIRRSYGAMLLVSRSETFGVRWAKEIINL